MPYLERRKVNVVHDKAQSGFAVLLVIVVVAVVAMLWVATKHEGMMSYFKSNQYDLDNAELKVVKQRLLEFAVLQPEIYLTNASNEIQNSSVVPAPGYFPCPDTDLPADDPSGWMNQPCTNELVLTDESTGFVTGFLPQGHQARRYYFAEPHRYYYVLDQRFSFRNNSYDNDGLWRFAPLGSVRLEGAFADIVDPSTDAFEPILTLNGRPGYIALIIDAGDDGLLDGVNDASNRHFISRADDVSDGNADKIIGITYDEWYSWMVHRVCIERHRIHGIDYDGDNTDPIDAIVDLQDIGIGTRHWTNDYHEVSNPSGANWREWGAECL